MSFTKKYFSLIILVSLVIGFVWQMPVWMIEVNTYALMLMMFLSCLNIDIKELKKAGGDWWRYLVILFFIFCWSVPFVWLARDLFDNEIFVGLMIAAAAPCGVSVIFLADLLGGDSTKGLVTTTLAHLLSPLVTPFLVLLMTSQVVEIHFIDLFLVIIKLVIVPFILAQIARQFSWHKVLYEKSQDLNTYLLAFMNWSLVSPISAMLIAFPFLGVKISAVVIASLVILAPMVYFFGRDKKEGITWAVVGVYKNTTLAAVLAASVLPVNSMIGPVVYGIIMTVGVVVIEVCGRRLSAQ
jgi:BASS family bile acid:Na+ symporter